MKFETNPKRRSSIESKEKNKNAEDFKLNEAASKKTVLALHDQLRPVLDCIDANCALIDVDFRFTLRGILLESSLYVCVFEDVPFTLFNQTNKAQVLF